jgi:hypothetical protein
LDREIDLTTALASKRPSLTDWVYLGLSALAVVIPVFKAPFFPINDPAFFEYFGRAMLHGQRLYVDLIDSKLPSIFVVNALWQALFGDNYALHTYAEAALNAASIALFAILLRRRQIPAWALGTFLFAVFFSIPFPQFNYTQHYAIFFIVLGLYLSARGWNLFAGGALALASTFWPPAALTCIPILLEPSGRRERILLLGGFLGTAGLYALAMVAAFGPHIFDYFLTVWTNYAGRAPQITISQLEVTLFDSALGPGIGVLLLLLLLAVRRPVSAASRFALIWSACALAGTAIPPRFSEHYFLPSVPALAMAIAAFGLSKKHVLRRPFLAVGAAALSLFMFERSATLARGFSERANEVVVVGGWIRSNIGAGGTVYPDEFAPELELAASARRPPTEAGLQDILRKRFAWKIPPQVIVFGPYTIPDSVRQGHSVTVTSGPTTRPFKYVPVCLGLTGPYAVYVLPRSAKAFRCSTYDLIFGPLS